MGVDLTMFLLSGETIVIVEELVIVREVHSDGFEIEEYHTRGTDDSPVLGYRMDNLRPQLFSYQNLEPIIGPGEMDELVHDLGIKTHLTVTAITISGSSLNLNFTPSLFTGTGTTVTTHNTLYVRKKVILPSTS